MKFVSLRLSALAACLAACACPAFADASVIPNGDFGLGEAAPTGWDLGKTPNPGTKLVRDAQVTHGAPASLRIDFTGPAQASAASVLTSAPSSLTLSGWTKTQGAIDSLSYNLQVFDANYKQIGWITSEDNDAHKLRPGDWQRFERDISLPDGAAHAVFYFTVKGGAGASAWLDAVQAIPPAKPDYDPAADARPIAASAPVKRLGQAPYRWGNAVMGGVEYATGIVINPKHPELLYSKCDTGGFFQLDRTHSRWVAMMDSIPYSLGNLFPVNSVAPDADHPNILFVSAGGSRWGTPFDILKTTDGGRHWARTGLKNAAGKDVIIDTGGDEKPAGERLAVDPNDGNVIYFGSQYDGLFVSRDAAKTWRPAANFPWTGAQGTGVDFVTFDWRGGTDGQPTRTLYVGVHGGNDAAGHPVEGAVYISQDAGASWQRLTGGPSGKANPIKGRIGLDHSLYLSCDGEGGLWRYRNSQWEDITPPDAKGKPFSGIGLHPTDPNILMCNTYDEHTPIFYSHDGGKTWIGYRHDKDHPEKGNLLLGFEPAWEKDSEGKMQWPTGYCSDIVFDPLNPNLVYETDFSGVNIGRGPGQPTMTFSLLSDGREQMTCGDVVSPSAGAPLISGIWDLGGFRHADLSQIPARIIPLITRDGHGEWGEHQFEDTFQLDANPNAPNVIVAAGGWQWNSTGDAAYSDDNGRTLHEFPAKPFQEAKFGRIAVGVDPNNVVWAPMGTDKTPPYFTTDNGKTWAAGQGAPLGTIAANGPWSFYKELAADRVKNGWFYLYDRRDGHFYRSEDGGATWKHVSTLPKQQEVHFCTHKVLANPSVGGEVWVSIGGATALGEHGLYRSTDGGATWTRLTGVEWADQFSFGKGQPGGPPALYLLGQVSGARPKSAQEADVWLFRSDDLGKTWVRLNTPAFQLPGAGSICGDMQKYGRVYICTGGRGVFYGEPTP